MNNLTVHLSSFISAEAFHRKVHVMKTTCLILYKKNTYYLINRNQVTYIGEVYLANDTKPM